MTAHTAGNENEAIAPAGPMAVLLIMDGLGIRESAVGNAVLNARTPTLDMLWAQNPHALLKAAGKEVGLSQGDPGNSEVGHLNMGSGQIVYQSQPRIDEYIRIGKFAEIPSLKGAFSHAKDHSSDLHIVGLLSATGVHAHIEHLFELMRICKTHKVNPFIHVITDGRDTGLKDGYLYLNMLKAKIQEFGIGRIASISGRTYAMDRDHRWDRTERAYNAMIGNGERKAEDPIEVLQSSYQQGENDQTLTPTTIVNQEGEPVGIVKENDAVIFYNYREDRARQLTRAFVVDNFDGFFREKIPGIYFLTMTGYEEGLPVKVLFDPFIIRSTVASIVSASGLKQLHVAESEKYAHVTYFFNGGVEQPHEGEEFIHIPSPKVFDFVEVPEMSAKEITDSVVPAIESRKYNFVLINLANPDMIGHTGNYEQTVKAVEFTDTCVRRIVEAVMRVNGNIIITADHGNAEEMVDEMTGEVNAAHTSNPVPVIICRAESPCVLDGSVQGVKIGTGQNAVERGILADIAPTVLRLLGQEPSQEMTGVDLLSVKL